MNANHKQKYAFYYYVFFLTIVLSHQVYPESGINFLREPIGAKANALGSAYTGSVKEPSALLWNPAGLSHISGREITMTLEEKKRQAEEDFKDLENEIESNEVIVNEPLPEIKRITSRTFEMQVFVTASQFTLNRQLGFTGIAFPVYFGSMGVGIQANRITGIEGYDADGISTGNLDYALYSAYLGYAFQTGPVRMGFTLIGIRENLGGKFINGGAIDVGIQFFTSIYELGASLQNLGGIIQKSASAKNQYTRLDIVLRLSGSVQILNTGIRIYLGLTSNIDRSKEVGPGLNFGLSYDLFKYTSLLVGLNRSRPSIGLDFDFPYITLSYALRSDKLKIGLEHYLDVNLAF